MRIAVFGLGEAGAAFAGDLAAAGAEVHGFDPAHVATPAGVTRHAVPASAVHGAQMVLALTAAADAPTALGQALDEIPGAALYADASTASPALKRRLDATAAEAGLAFVDVALMAPVPGQGIRTPAIASGRAAERFVTLVRPLGVNVAYSGDEPGQAAVRKLLRSIVVKGLAALLIEAMDAADAAGLAEETWANLAQQLTDADEAFLRRLVEGTAPHARRRLHEMEAAQELLGEVAVDGSMTTATVASLRRIDAGGALPELPSMSDAQTDTPSSPQ